MVINKSKTMKNTQYILALILGIIISSHSNQIISKMILFDIKIPSSEKLILIQRKDSISKEIIPSSAQLYSEIENLQDSNINLKRDISTKSKKYIQQMGNIKNEIVCYYQNDKLILIESKSFNEIRKNISFKIFDFTENNKCIIVSIKNEGENECCYYFKNKYIAEYTMNLNPIILDNSKKLKIISIVKTALDSTMAHFPEFKYSFDWK